MSQKWSLVADIGGTNARFSALLEGQLESQYEFHHSVEEYPEFGDLIVILLQEIKSATGWGSPPSSACFAVACPADSEIISFTNSHWIFSKSELQALVGCEILLIINDFEAVAHGITELSEVDLVQVGGEVPVANKAIGIMGAGTGLGVACLVPHPKGYHVLDTEGGHADYSPIDDMQSAVVNTLRARFGRVSLERLLSGKGLLNIYTALCSIENDDVDFETPAEVVAAALDNTDTKALQTLNMFCEGVGAAAGNLALTFGAKGGIYIAGGVIPRFQEFFIKSGFRNKFEDKGRFVSYLQPIPVYLVTRSNLGLLGAAKKYSNFKELLVRNLLSESPIIPVITLDRVSDAVPLAEALLAGGLRVLEITLRTEAAIEGIKEIIRQVPGAIVGSGTVCNAEQIALSEDIGCQFMVSPGSTDGLLAAAEGCSIPLLPGVSSVSELMRGLDYGHSDFKFFPAEASGGVNMLKSIAGPFADVRFCATGGIGLHNVADYLALDNILSVGGSWITAANLIREKRWADIEKLAQEATVLAGR